ncbi:MAG: peptide chain release factor N(5)-glutamine methyltransferase [Nitrospirota bacterium]|nr:peptide chain release factor N(5)-glutamine methyltransferase [Nitrospirota bacterium]
MASTASADEKTWTVIDLLKEATDFLTKKEVSRSPRLDVELLLADTLGLNRVGLYTNFEKKVTEQERTVFRELFKRRLNAEPVAYIRGKREFWGLEMEVSPAVLIPRPETEVLVEEAIKTVGGKSDSALTILDLCTGSGCVAVALAKDLSEAKVWATDISAEALDVARRNAARHGVDSRVSFCAGDLWDAVSDQELEGAVDMIVANPPYIPNTDIDGLERNVKDFEPLSALDGGNEGLDIIRRIIAEAPRFLKPSGALLMEIGYNQGVAVSALMEEKGFTEVRVLKDYCGLDRVVIGLR